MAILKPFFGLLLVAIIGSGLSASAQTNAKKEIVPSDVVRCQTLEDVNRAKGNGAIFIEFRNNFWVKVGSDYKGPFRTLLSAQKIYNQRKLENSKNPPKTTPSKTSSSMPRSATPAVQQGSPYYNPQLILFPFVEYKPDRRILLSIPGGQTVEASQVMIHPEPLEFENITFGMIDLSLFTKSPQSPSVAESPISTSTPSLPDNSNQPVGKYFAVTGRIAARETIAMPTAPLTYWVGAAVIGKDESVLWRQYGEVDNTLSFKCIGRMPETRIESEYLLLFTLAKGKLDFNIRPLPQFPELNAKPYSYHVLCSSTLEMGPNWFPPLQAATKAEYDKMMESMYREKIEKFKQQTDQKNEENKEEKK